MIYFVATPIGNLEDISQRALRILKESDVIFCEDTRHSSVLLSHYGINVPLKSYHKFNEQSRCDYILSLSREGKTVSMISDAGMPCISDPGTVLVNACKAAGEKYSVVTGACAAVTAFAMSGFLPPFTFVGFLPSKTADKDKLIDGLGNATLIFYSAPHDLNDDLKYLYAALGDRKVAVIKELTKIHEKAEFFDLSTARIEDAKGEYVIVVQKADAQNALNTLSPEQHVEFYIDKGLSKMDAIKQTAKDRGVSKNEIYKLLI